jgi:hypothetical protein
MFAAYSLHVHWKSTECSTESSTERLPKVHWMFLECSLNVQSMFPECSPRQPWYFFQVLLAVGMEAHGHPLNSHWMFTAHYLQCPCQGCPRKGWSIHMCVCCGDRTEYSLNVHWMFTECSLNVHWMFTECSLNVHQKLTRCSLNIHRTLPLVPLLGLPAQELEYSYVCLLWWPHWMFTECSLNAHWMLPECWSRTVSSAPAADALARSGVLICVFVVVIALSVHWMITECSLNVHW